MKKLMLALTVLTLFLVACGSGTTPVEPLPTDPPAPSAPDDSGEEAASPTTEPAEEAPPTATTEPTLPVSTPLPSPSPTETPTPTLGERIRIYECLMSGSCRIEFPAGSPFYIRNGWWNEEFIDDSDAAFFLEVDGVRIDPDGSGTIPSEKEGIDGYDLFWIFSFPDGMTGTHTFTGTWVPREQGQEWGTNTASLIIDFVP